MNFDTYANKITSLLQGTEPLVHSPKILDNGATFHDLSRDRFVLRVNDGQLDEV
jgi:hypothetical protein